MENGRGTGPTYQNRAIDELQKLSTESSTYSSYASVMIRHVEYPNLYPPLHRFHHFYDINTSDSLASSFFTALCWASVRVRQ